MTSRTLAGLAGLALLLTAGCRSNPPSATGSPPQPPAPPVPQLDAAAPPAQSADERSSGTLAAFADEAELGAFMARWRAADQERRRVDEERRRGPSAFPMKAPDDLDGGAPPPVSPSPSPQPSASAPARAVAESAKSGESITNNQHAGVDEGDIVKLHGDHLVVLRRGRLFTLSLKDGKIQKSAVKDAFGPEIDPAGTWYDEMVVEGDHVVVVGFSYARGGTEVGLFRIDAEGQLTYRGTYQLRSNDYYSARNYASRVVDGKLVFYSPMYLSPYDTEIAPRLPAVRRWHRGAADGEFVRTLAPTQLFRVGDEVLGSPAAALHTVTSCDLKAPELRCESVAMLGPPGRVFYVSPSSVYVWMQDWAAPSRDVAQDRPRGLLARLPLVGARAGVTAVRVSGMPTDQFSFEEDDTGSLDVLVRSESNGDAMFASERTAGAASLLRVPLSLFSRDVPIVSPRRYRPLPRPDGWSVQNRFVGPWLLYGSGGGYVASHEGRGQLYAVRYASEHEARVLTLEQGIDRIEPMGDDAVVVGSRGRDLVFTPVGLGEDARLHRDYVRKDASQGELRSHGFFYKPARGGAGEGIIGLPIRSDAARGATYLLEGSASVLFLERHGFELNELGALAATPLATTHDGCRASCVDWYGNARPIFAKDRVFALLGYELVEGRVDNDGGRRRIGQRARLSFAPRGGPPALD